MFHKKKAQVVLLLLMFILFCFWENSSSYHKVCKVNFCGNNSGRRFKSWTGSRIFISTNHSNLNIFLQRAFTIRLFVLFEVVAQSAFFRIGFEWDKIQLLLKWNLDWNKKILEPVRAFNRQPRAYETRMLTHRLFSYITNRFLF